MIRRPGVYTLSPSPAVTCKLEQVSKLHLPSAIFFDSVTLRCSALRSVKKRHKTGGSLCCKKTPWVATAMMPYEGSSLSLASCVRSSVASTAAGAFATSSLRLRTPEPRSWRPHQRSPSSIVHRFASLHRSSN